MAAFLCACGLVGLARLGFWFESCGTGCELTCSVVVWRSGMGLWDGLFWE